MNKAGRGALRLAWVVLLGLVLAVPRFANASSPVVVLEVQDAIGPASADYLVRGIAKAARARCAAGRDQARYAGRTRYLDATDHPGDPGVDGAGRRLRQPGRRARRQRRHLHPVRGPCRCDGAGTPRSAPRRRWPSACRAGGRGKPAERERTSAASAPDREARQRHRAQCVRRSGRRSRRRGEGPKPASRTARRRARLPLGDAMTAKQVNDAAAFIRGLAQQRGRNAEWAERAVREAVSLTASEALREQGDRRRRRRPARPAGADRWPHGAGAGGRASSWRTRGLATEAGAARTGGSGCCR